MSDKYIIDISTIDFDNVVADIDEIRKYNRQRFEMEHLTAIVYDNLEDKTCVGYKDITPDEFWVRGHMPGMPLMPGVIMLEAAAQMSSYFVQKHDLLKAEVVGFGGLEDVRFGGPAATGSAAAVISIPVSARDDRSDHLAGAESRGNPAHPPWVGARLPGRCGPHDL